MSMKKFKEGEPICPELQRAVDEAEDQAIESMGYVYPHLCEKGTGLGSATCFCEGCKKKVKVTVVGERIEASSDLGKTVGYTVNSPGSKTVVKFSGTPCARELMKR